MVLANFIYIFLFNVNILLLANELFSFLFYFHSDHTFKNTEGIFFFGSS